MIIPQGQSPGDFLVGDRNFETRDFGSITINLLITDLHLQYDRLLDSDWEKWEKRSPWVDLPNILLSYQGDRVKMLLSTTQFIFFMTHNDRKLNKQLVDIALEDILTPALKPFIGHKMKSKYGSNWLQDAPLSLEEIVGCVSTA